jgi:copper homeostasis protein (lipoprotein)
MNRQSLAIAIAFATLSIAGCKREAAAPPAVEAAPADATKSAVISEIDHNSPASAAPAFDIKAFAGLYAGIVPCADCPGIDTSIAFTPEGTYSMSETYQEEGGGSFVTKGTWTVREDGKTELLDPEDKEERDRSYEIVSATELRALDRDGKAIDSKLDYSLRRK